MKKLIYLFLLSYCLQAISQVRPEEATFEDLGTEWWMGSYNKFRIHDKWIWDAQHHYRRSDYNGVAFVGKMGKFYNRHALTYVYNKNLYVTLGGVLRLNYSPKPDNTIDYAKLRYEPRIWHEYLFVLPIKKAMVYHRIRVEHRWSIDNKVGSEWIYRNRWRYKFFTMIPLNKPKLEPGTYYFLPDVEIILQSGKVIVDSPLEDLRIYPQFGYILNPRLKFGIGLMYSTGQSLSNGSNFSSRLVLRTNVYLSLDFRKFENKLPDINVTD
jgi:hypothetical protein